MRVLQINAVYGFGSTGRNVQEMHEYYLNHKIESYIACAMFQDKIPVNGYKIGNLMDRKIHAFFSRLLDLQGYFSIIATKRLIKHIKHIQPDIVHLHNFHSNYICLAMLLKYVQKHSIATVVTLHDCYPFTGKCFHFSNCFQWKTGTCANCQKKNNIPPSYRLCNQAHRMYIDKAKLWSSISKLGVIGVSDWITNHARCSMLADAKVIRCIYNWIDPDIFHYHYNENVFKRYHRKDNNLLIAVSISWSEEKGLYDLLTLMNLLGSDYILLLVGKIPNKIILPDNVIGIGRTSSVQELVELYSVADVFVNPSQMETFGKVTIEALACGIPAVVYDATACPELVPEKCGLVVPLHNVEEFATAVRVITQNGKDYYKAECVRYVHNTFLLDKIAEQQIELFKELYESDE